jgi:PAS domain S-box-containing protein
MILVADHADRIMSFDQNLMMKMFGYSVPEVLGAPIELLIPEMQGGRDMYMARFPASSVDLLLTFRHSVSGVRKDGAHIPLGLSITAGRNELGDPKFTWVIRDVTERVWLNTELHDIVQSASNAAIEQLVARQLAESNEKLRVANEGLQKFTSIVAHDFRAPLRRVESFIRLLQTEYGAVLDDEGLDLLDRAARGVDRMRLMLDSLLQYSRYSGAAIAGKTAVLADVIADALSTFDMAALDVEIEISVSDVSAVKGDPLLLSHVLQNLISNAVKFRTETMPQVRIVAHQTGQEITIFVADNGIGVEPAFADKIFEMFYRLHDDEEYEGTGIGLSVCRKIISDHGGRIWLDTTYEAGSKFAFTLQAAGDALQPSDVQRGVERSPKRETLQPVLGSNLDRSRGR